MEYTIFNTELGWVAVLASQNGLVGISLPRSTAEEALGEIDADITDANNSPAGFMDLTIRLKAYFAGEKVYFPDELDLSTVTPFHRKVCQAARNIPYGETRSYKWLATEVGSPKAARAVGQAMAKNRLPIVVPCHRVTGGSDIGGFSGGVYLKKRLLQLETSVPGSTGQSAE